MTADLDSGSPNPSLAPETCKPGGNATFTCAFCGHDIHVTFGADGNVGPVACPGCGSTYLSGATVLHPLLGAADPLHTHNTPETPA